MKRSRWFSLIDRIDNVVGDRSIMHQVCELNMQVRTNFDEVGLIV